MINNRTSLTPYGHQLLSQARDRTLSKERDRYQSLKDDFEMLNYQANNDPFGRGGSGAPLRDQYGRVITTRQPYMRQDYSRAHINQQQSHQVPQQAAGIVPPRPEISTQFRPDYIVRSQQKELPQSLPTPPIQPLQQPTYYPSVQQPPYIINTTDNAANSTLMLQNFLTFLHSERAQTLDQQNYQRQWEAYEINRREEIESIKQRENLLNLQNKLGNYN